MVSRSIGDLFAHRCGCRAEPYVVNIPASENLSCIIIASDGLWDVISPQEAVELACREANPTAASQKLMDYALEKRSHDNITTMVMFHYGDSSCMCSIM